MAPASLFLVEQGNLSLQVARLCFSVFVKLVDLQLALSTSAGRAVKVSKFP